MKEDKATASGLTVLDATAIEDVCKSEFYIGDNNTDCKWFVKAVADHFLDASAFPNRDSGFDADGIISDYLTQHGWTALGQDQDSAMTEVSNGNFVIGGMLSSQFGKRSKLAAQHGHLAVIVGGREYAGSAKKNVPRCYSGSISDAGRVPRPNAGQGVNWSFGANKVDAIKYFSIAPTKSPFVSERAYSESVAVQVVKELIGELSALVGANQKSNNNALFPKGINRFELSVTIAAVKVDLKIEGA
jgi:hypothetical protein